jgi:BirA family transcriptional regulator, biotin operon repressor / biotin---[acetyl-CoA-carboxylase] ligase
LYLSLLHRFKQPVQGLMGLSLAIAIAISRALQEVAKIDVQLKWPNDILYKGKKLCGILLELQSESFGPAAVVIGIGLNVRLSEQDKKQIDQPCIALEEIIENPIARNQLAISVIREVLRVLSEFEQSGLGSFQAKWQRQDAYLDRPVCVILGNTKIHGISRGIDENGALLVESKGQIQRYYSGEISLQAES